MDARCIRSVEVGRAPGQTERRRKTDTGRAGREPNEWCRRGGVAIERFGMELFEECRGDRRVAPEPEQIFQPELKLLIVRQQIGRGDPRDLVAQGPHRIKAERLVPGRVGNDVGVLSPGMREIVVHHIEEQSRDEAAGRNRAARVAGKRRIIEHDRAERPVNEIERLAMIEFRFIQRFAFLGDAISGVEVEAAPRAERHA